MIFKNYIRFFLFLPLFLLLLVSCTTMKLPGLTLKNVIEIPYGETYQDTKVGGLSGIDYDAKNNEYYLISDDRADRNKARIYIADINIKNDSLRNVKFKKIIFLKNDSGEDFMSYNVMPSKSVDPEDVRYLAQKNVICWSNEGERKDGVYLDPTIWLSDDKGNFLQSFTLPNNLKMSSEGKGPRRNGVLEGISFFKNSSKLMASVEEPLYEDDNEADTERGALIRLFEFDVKKKNNTAQFYYKIDPVAKVPNPKTAFSINGVSAILHQKGNTFWVVERSYSTGYQACTIKLYLTKTEKSKNLLKSDKKPADNILQKSLVLNLDNLGIFVDNIEGITYGPKLSNGNQSLLLISDNNFSTAQKTQIFLFEIKRKK